MQHIFIHPIAAAVFGWLAFNVLLFRIEKDQADDAGQHFNLGKYVQKTWDNWLASFFFIPVLLFIGYNRLEIGMIDAQSFKWSDLYYLCSGFAAEVVIVAWKKWKNKNG